MLRWCGLILLLICALGACRGGTEEVFDDFRSDATVTPPPPDEGEGEDEAAPIPKSPQLGGTSTGNPLSFGDGNVSGTSVGNPIVVGSGSKGQGSCSTGPDIAQFSSSARVYLIGQGTNATNDIVIDLATHVVGLLWPLKAPGPSYLQPHPLHVATHPKGGVAFLLAKAIPFAGGKCAFFALDPSLTLLQCIDPTMTNVGVLPKAWGLPPSFWQSPIQFDDEGNVYYRWVPENTTCEETTKGTISPSVQIRRWDRATHAVTNAPLGAFLPLQFRVVADGALLLAGFDTAAGAGDEQRLRHLLPTGSWHELALPFFWEKDLPFLTIDEQTVMLPMPDADGLFSVPFDAAGFGMPQTLVSATDNLQDLEGYLYSGTPLALQHGPSGELYTLNLGITSPGSLPPWNPRAIVQVLPQPPQFIASKAKEPFFFKVIDDQLYVVGKDTTEKWGLFRANIASPEEGIDLLGGTGHLVSDFLVVGDRIYFAGSYGGPGLGRIDMAEGNALTILATKKAPYGKTYLYPIWPKEPSEPLPDDVGVGTVPTSAAFGKGYGCFLLDLNWSIQGLGGGAPLYLPDMTVETDEVIASRDQLVANSIVELGDQLLAKIWPLVGFLGPMQIATHPVGGIVFLNWEPVPFGEGSCALFALDPAFETVQCIDPTVTNFGLPPEPWDLPHSLRRSAIQFDAAGNIYYRWVPPLSPCEFGAKESLNPQAQIRRWDRVTGTTATYPLGAFLPLRFQTLEDGALLVSGFDLATAATGPWPVLRYVEPGGDWHEMALAGFGQSDVPFHVINAHTMVFPLLAYDTSFSATFGEGGFGAPHPLMSAEGNLVDEQQSLHWGLALQTATDSKGTLYTLDQGRPLAGTWWSGNRQLLRVLPGPATVLSTKIADAQFFHLANNRLYVAGIDTEGKHALFRVPPSAPWGTIDLLGTKNIKVGDLLVRGNSVFFTGYEIGPTNASSGPRLGWIDMQKGNAITILATPDITPILFPYWSGGATP